MEVQPIVQIKNLTKKIGRKTIIDNLSFDVPGVRFLVFWGPMVRGKQQPSV
jgi:ABC-2 type transport system ATP-binding protein